jgi:hypothetical protein
MGLLQWSGGSVSGRARGIDPPKGDEATVAIVETGTIILDGTPDQDRMPAHGFRDHDPVVDHGDYSGQRNTAGALYCRPNSSEVPPLRV